MIIFVRKWLRRIMFVVYSLLATSLLLFGLFELFPNLIERVNLQRIKYYALKSAYVSDPSLVFTPRVPDYAGSFPFNGDMYQPAYGVSAPGIRYTESYKDGFRVNSSHPPFQMVFLGDSFVQVGEDDASTLSERLAAETGLSTFNLGRSWYGPFQYLELLKMYGIALRPRIALFCFFSGNDIEDIKQYQRWRESGSYYFYEGQLSQGVFRRYVIALSDTANFLGDKIKALKRYLPRNTESDAQPNRVHPDLGVFRIGTGEIKMAFSYWNQEGSTAQLLASPEWQVLKSILSEFRLFCLRNNIQPLLVYIPSKIQVYDQYATENSGRSFKKKLAEHYPFRKNAHEAFTTLARELNLTVIDLLPYFEHLAAQGQLLYYPFDTHWNKTGIRAAANHIALSIVRLK